jgi:hypothetical protein
MAGMGRIVKGLPRRPAMWVILGVAALSMTVPAPATAKTVTVHTSRGGTCHLQTIAKRTGTEVTYGIKVTQCSTKFGVRYAVSQGALYDEDNGNQAVANGYLGNMKGHLPYQHQRSVTGTSPSHTYRTRIDISIVLKTRRNARTRHPERWTHSGRLCRVKTTNRQGDTLGCEISENLAGT